MQENVVNRSQETSNLFRLNHKTEINPQQYANHALSMCNTEFNIEIPF